MLWFCLSKGIHAEHKTQDLGYFREKWSEPLSTCSVPGNMLILGWGGRLTGFYFVIMLITNTYITHISVCIKC